MRPFKTLAEYGCGGILQPGEKLRIKLHVAHGRGSIEKDVFLRSQPVVGKQFIPHMLSEGFQKFGNAAHGLRRVIEARHDGVRASMTRLSSRAASRAKFSRMRSLG